MAKMCDLLPEFVNDCVILEQLKTGKYLVAMIGNVLPGVFGRSIGVRYLAMFDSISNHFSHEWKHETFDYNIMNLHTHIISLFSRGRNISEIPYMINQRTTDREAYFHYLSIFWMENEMTEEEFSIHKTKCIENIIKNFEREDAEDKRKQEEYIKEKIEKREKLKLEMENMSYKELRSKVFFLDDYEANMFLKYTREKYSSEFDDQDWTWKRIRPICAFSDCDKGCSKDETKYLWDENPYISFCYLHK